MDYRLNQSLLRPDPTLNPRRLLKLRLVTLDQGPASEERVQSRLRRVRRRRACGGGEELPVNYKSTAHEHHARNEPSRGVRGRGYQGGKRQACRHRCRRRVNGGSVRSPGPRRVVEFFRAGSVTLYRKRIALKMNQLNPVVLLAVNGNE